MRDIDWETVKEQGWQRLAVPERYAPFAEGGFPTPSVPQFYSETAAKLGLNPLLPTPRRAENVHSAPELARRYRLLAFISPPCCIS